MRRVEREGARKEREKKHIPFIALIFGGLQIPRLLFGTHGAPDAFPGAVALDVVELRADDQQHIVGDEDDEAEVAFAVEGLVFIAVDLC